ncbi:MAG TPA: class I SAM-dependent methyltransferase [Caulobacteraceae bacterium]|jgi:SAM-dependent methyltransferase|nr:class I SAM-dependent methyltransferase [Caulobacteraceae bacterium]
MTGLTKTRAASFGAAADAYERARPSYPEAAIDWILPKGAHRVLDLGAGTGKLSRLLRARGLEVVAVEPSDGMRAQFSRGLPDVPVLAGSAETIPLDDASVDAVVVGQAWHWFDPARAVGEAARVLKPGGALGLIWNIRDLRDPWMNGFSRLEPEHDNSEAESENPRVGPPFGPVERFDLEWRQSTTPAALIELLASRSYVIVLSEPQRAALFAKVRRFLETDPATAGKAEISVPYVTRCSRACVR